MAILQCFVLALFLNLIFPLHAQSQDSALKQFGQKVKSLLPNKTFKHLFNVNHDNTEQFLQAVHHANEDDAKVYSTTFPEDLGKKLQTEARKIADTITPKQEFRIYLNAVGNTLMEEGVLNSNNLEDMARSFTKYLEDASKAAKKENVAITIPTISTYVFKFFKSVGLKEDVIKRYINNLIDEVIKAQQN